MTGISGRSNAQREMAPPETDDNTQIVNDRGRRSRMRKRRPRRLCSGYVSFRSLLSRRSKSLIPPPGLSEVLFAQMHACSDDISWSTSAVHRPSFQPSASPPIPERSKQTHGHSAEQSEQREIQKLMHKHHSPHKPILLNSAGSASSRSPWSRRCSRASSLRRIRPPSPACPRCTCRAPWRTGSAQSGS